MNLITEQEIINNMISNRTIVAEIEAYNEGFTNGISFAEKQYEDKLRFKKMEQELPFGECIVKDILNQHSIRDFSGANDTDIQWIIETDKLIEWRSFF